MQIASLHEIKRELNELPSKSVLDLCMRLLKHKKENKELMSYLLFEAGDELNFIQKTKLLIDAQFENMNDSNIYLAKKTLRKVLRTVNKYIRFSDSEKVGIELLLHFCLKLKLTHLPLTPNTVIGNIYQQQIKKINLLLKKMHDDLQYDYNQRMEEMGIKSEM